MLKSNGAIIYKDAMIMVIVTGINRPSLNRKTGGMLQTWILNRHVNPVRAIGTPFEGKICGDCKHSNFAGRGTCYVNVGQAPLAIWVHAYKYPDALDYLSIASLGYKKAVRLGSYGDPAFVPTSIWAALTLNSKFNTGYTHQWKICDPDLKMYCMASVDSEIEASLAQSMGWRTFRVGSVGEAERVNKEAMCPASERAGNKVTCYTCPLALNGANRVPACGGTSVKGPNIVIEAHGRRKKYV